MKKKYIMCCWECREGLKIAYDVVAEDGDSATFYFCNNKKCPRYGLATITFKTRESKPTIQRGRQGGTK